MSVTVVPADVYDRIQRISLGMYGRLNAGLQDHERARPFDGSSKPDCKLAEELLAMLERGDA